jgi:hypothetical protein
MCDVVLRMATNIIVANAFLSGLVHPVAAIDIIGLGQNIVAVL